MDPSRVPDGRPGRIDDYAMASGPIAEPVGARRVFAPSSPRRSWWTAGSGAHGHRDNYEDEALPPDTESRLGQFTELMATAIANTESRAEVERLAEEQAALRRVATLVAEGAPPTAVFDAVAAEMEGLLGADRVSLSRYEPGDEIAVLAHRGSGRGAGADRLAAEPRGRERAADGAAHGAARPDGELRGSARRHR